MRTLFKLMLVLALAILGACATKPPTDYPKTPSFALEDTSLTKLGKLVSKRTGGRGPDESGFFVLRDGVDALAARLILAGHAERSIDTQYFLIQNDISGVLFINSLLDAADRGVRVRLLVDDIQTVGEDAAMTAIDSHPNIELRVYNPYAHRSSARNIEYITDLSRVDYRMHNKSFTVDSQVAVVGGRNIGDEYFDANPEFEFADLDLAGIGPVSKQVSHAFDTYWNSEFAFPAGALVESTTNPQALRDLRKSHDAVIADPKHATYQAGLHSVIIDNILKPGFPLFWGNATVVFDDPEKTEGEESAGKVRTVRSVVSPKIRATESELMVVSPYFVIQDEGVASFRKLRDSGVRIVVMTNSLASTDMVPAHAGYAHYRMPLVEMGVELHEVKPDASFDEESKSGGDFTHTAVHMKAFTIDRRFIFVGSFNWDPRSSYLNTEMGLFIESPGLAEWAVNQFEDRLPRHTFSVSLDKNGDLRWVDTSGANDVVFDDEPMTSAWRRFTADFMGILPVEGEL